jgi:putative spermidine/putrescine transport system permease protein
VIFVFITSFDQATVSIFLAGPDVMPLPVRIYSYIDYAVDPMIAAVSTLLILFAFAVIAALQKLLGLDRAMGVG